MPSFSDRIISFHPILLASRTAIIIVISRKLMCFSGVYAQMYFYGIFYAILNMDTTPKEKTYAIFRVSIQRPAYWRISALPFWNIHHWSYLTSHPVSMLFFHILTYSHTIWLRSKSWEWENSCSSKWYQDSVQRQRQRI